MVDVRCSVDGKVGCDYRGSGRLLTSCLFNEINFSSLQLLLVERSVMLRQKHTHPTQAPRQLSVNQGGLLRGNALKRPQ